MSDAVMSASSPYRESIKFYERMSDLQGELKNYEAQEFQLEKEFERLWTQGVNRESSSGSAGKGSSTSSQARLGKFGHLTKNQLLANPLDPNYCGKNEEVECRRRSSARNQMILDKLQELETNASIFAARSERLRMMRNEYESLVRKYASNRKRGNSSEVRPAYYYTNNGYQSQSFPTINRSQKTGPVLTSVGVNTDITGPIKPISLDSRTLLPSSGNIVQDSGREPEKPLSNLNEGRESNGLKSNDAIYSKSTRPTFLDISSTSESEFVGVPKPKQYRPDRFEETSADTTSVSVFVPKPIASNYMLNLATDGSLTESTSAVQLPNRESTLKRFTKARAESGHDAMNKNLANAGGNGKQLINSVSHVPGTLSQDNGNDFSSSSDSTSNIIGDSMMDSVQNKTPESPPKDDSELLHIAEVDEAGDMSSVSEYQHHQKQYEYPTDPTVLINETGSPNQETWDNLSSSNLVRVAQKEIGIRYVEEPQLSQSDPLNQLGGRVANIKDLSGNVDLLDSKVKELLMKKGSGIGTVGTRETPKDESIKTEDGRVLSGEFINLGGNTLKLSSSPPDSSSSSSSSRNLEEKPHPLMALEKVGRSNKGDSQSTQEPKNETDGNPKPTMTQFGISSESLQPKNPNVVSPSISDPFLVTSQIEPNKQTSMPSNSGNEGKKRRIRVDYGDTGSDSSDGKPVNKEKVKASMHQPPTKLDESDEFDGFYDN